MKFGIPVFYFVAKEAMDKGSGRYWAAFTLLCLTVAWLTINIVWWTQSRKTDELAVPAVLFVLGAYLFWRESRRRSKSDRRK